MLQIVTASDLATEISALYKEGLPPGTSTGWRNLDPLYTVSPGSWTVVTGIPSHGKSTWLDCMMINLMKRGWRFAIYSPENQPHELHLAGLCEKLLRMPFRAGYNNRMEPSDMARAIDFFDERLRILRFDNGAIYPSLETFMFTCQEVFNDWAEGPIGVILDPINELDHTPVTGMNETQMTNWELMRFRQWVRAHGKQVHAWIVAHPAKPMKDKNGEYKDVTLYDISGSAAWKNKSDMGIVIRRRDDCTVVDVEKCRWRHLGKQGQAYLTFNSGTQTYEDQQPFRKFDDDETDT